MDFAKALNSVGLFYNIIGAILIFKCGIPNIFTVKWQLETNSEVLKDLNAKGKSGIILFILGFSLQLISCFF